MLWWLGKALRSGTTEGSGGDQGAAGAPPAEGAASPPADGAGAPPARPEWLPETFWRDGVPDYEGLGKSYNELRTAFSSKEEAIRGKVLADLRAGVPESPDKYEVKLDPAWLPPGFEAKTIAADDPLISAARPILHKLGAKQEDFNALTQAFVQWQAQTLPNPVKEREALGEHAEARISAVDAFLAKQLDKAGYDALADVATTAPAIAALERLMMLVEPKQPGAAGPQGQGAPIISPDEAATMLMHTDYNHPVKGREMREKFQRFVAAGGRVPGFQKVGQG
jgi:hypothetical protein